MRDGARWYHRRAIIAQKGISMGKHERPKGEPKPGTKEYDEAHKNQSPEQDAKDWGAATDAGSQKRDEPGPDASRQKPGNGK